MDASDWDGKSERRKDQDCRRAKKTCMHYGIERQDNITDRRKRKFEMLNELDHSIERLERRLQSGFPKYIAQQACSKTRDAAVNLIGTGRAERMAALAYGRWLYRVSWHAALEITRRKHHTVSLTEEIVLVAKASEPLEALEEWAIVRQAVAQLDECERQVVMAIYFEKQSHREAAARFGVSVATLGRILVRARHQLRLTLTSAAKES